MLLSLIKGCIACACTWWGEEDGGGGEKEEEEKVRNSVLGKINLKCLLPHGNRKGIKGSFKYNSPGLRKYFRWRYISRVFSKEIAIKYMNLIRQLRMRAGIENKRSQHWTMDISLCEARVTAWNPERVISWDHLKRVLMKRVSRLEIKIGHWIQQYRGREDNFLKNEELHISVNCELYLRQFYQPFKWEAHWGWITNHSYSDLTVSTRESRRGGQVVHALRVPCTVLM